MSALPLAPVPPVALRLGAPVALVMLIGVITMVAVLVIEQHVARRRQCDPRRLDSLLEERRRCARINLLHMQLGLPPIDWRLEDSRAARQATQDGARDDKTWREALQ